MKHLLSLLLFVAAASVLLAQDYEVSGSVADSHGDPLPFATVSLLRADSTLATGCVSQADGTFSMSVGKAGDYILRASFVGYKSGYVSISVAGRRTSLSVIVLQPEATMLQGVEITAKAPIIEQQIDKIVVNVSQSAFAQGNSAYDLLRKSPGVTVDKDGNVSLNGNSVAVWVDGRPTQLDGKALEALLSGTDGSNIDKIEVMANPSAKYDAAGTGGIINIKTRRTLMQGLNGTLTANYGGMLFSRPKPTLPGTPAADSRSQYLASHDLSLNIAYRTDKTNTFLQISDTKNEVGADCAIETSSDHLYQYSNASHDIDMQGFNLKVGNDWFINKHNTLGFIYTMPFNSMEQYSDSSRNITYQMLDGAYTQQSLTTANTVYRSHQYSGNVNYTHIFNEALQRELTVNLDIFRNHNEPSNDQFNYSAFSAPFYVRHPYLYSLENDNFVDIYSAKVDYQGVVLKMFMMEAGAKWATTATDNSLQTLSSFYDAVSGSQIPGLSHTQFNYREHVGALYATLAGQLSPQFSAKVGLRAEQTLNRGDWQSADTVTEKSYLDLFPSVFLGYMPSTALRFSLSYTRRIQRPSYNTLNPFRNYIDAHTYNIGNPNLRPAYSNNIMLNAGIGRYVNINAMCIVVTDYITMVPHINLATGDQALSWDNFGRQALMGGSLSLSELPLFSPLTLTLQATAFAINNYEDQAADIVEGLYSYQSYQNSSMMINGYACFTYTPANTWKIQLDGFVVSPIDNGYFKTHWNYSANLAVKKSFLQGRLVVDLNVKDLFRSLNSSFEIIGSDLVASLCQQKVYYQKVALGVLWNFGTVQKPLRHRNVGELEEASRTGNSNSLGGNQ